MKKTITYIFGITLIGNFVNAETLIYAGNIINGVSNQIQSNMTIHISENKISKIVPGFSKPLDDDKTINLKSSTVMPGLIDTHVHLTGEYNAKSQLQRFVLNEADYALNASLYAKKTLEAGFTVVRNLGDSYNATIALRKAINNKIVPGPLILTAGKTLSSTGGHGDSTNGWAKSIMGDHGPKNGIVNGADDARKAVRQRYKDGADWIKITATGGVLSVAKSGQNPQFTDMELNAIVETANDYGMRVAAHAHGTEGMKRAVLAGVASIEHGTYMDREIMQIMKQQGTYFVPTLLAGNWVAEKAKIDGFFPDLVRPKAAEIGPIAINTFAEAYEFGVPIVFGTDTGVSAHGDNAQEFALMVKAGMPEMEAIQSATSIAADFLEIGDTHGSITEGKVADIIAVQGNPLDNIRLMENVHFVMKGGVVFK
jgi:imidazolonepropionase-like amidohydrolase|tara:strand:+ start:9315 stop:10592 length:1278 start_codon:yes stop_codon:yes gene_type:complete